MVHSILNNLNLSAKIQKKVVKTNIICQNNHFIAENCLPLQSENSKKIYNV